MSGTSLPFEFVAASYAASKGGLTDVSGGILPLGLQPFTIVNGTVEDAKSLNTATGNPNKIVRVHVRVFEGPNAGSEGALNFNLGHENEKTREIAKDDFSKLLYCIGLAQTPVRDLSVLKGRRFLGNVTPQMVNGEPHEKGYTEIKGDGYETLEGHKPYLPGGGIGKGRLHSQAATQPTPAPAQAAPAAPAGDSWGGTPAPAQQPTQPAAQPAQPAASDWSTPATPAAASASW